jgi:hypothetical protein
MKFGPPKQLSQQKKTEIKCNSVIPTLLSSKQMAGTNSFLFKSLKRKTLLRPRGRFPNFSLRFRGNEAADCGLLSADLAAGSLRAVCAAGRSVRQLPVSPDCVFHASLVPETCPG